MVEILLRPNRRVLVGGLILPAVLEVGGLALAVGLGQSGLLWWAVGGAIALSGMLMFAMIISQARMPRLAYRDGMLLVGLRLGSPIRLPLEVSECAFLGSGPSQLPCARAENLKSANLVIRLNQGAAEFANREVRRELGAWRDGYITIHGAWCEPLTLETVQRVNARLHALKSLHASTQPAESEGGFSARS